jgi:hypothetical protein
MGCSFLLILPYFSLVSHLFEITIAFLIHKRYIPDPEQLNQQRFKCAAQMREPLYINENIAQSSLPSLQEIAKLSLSERHKLLRPFIQEMAEDINKD